MSVKLLTEHHLEFLSLKEAAQARLSQLMSKCHIVRNHVSRLIYYVLTLIPPIFLLSSCFLLIGSAAYIQCTSDYFYPGS